MGTAGYLLGNVGRNSRLRMIEKNREQKGNSVTSASLVLGMYNPLLNLKLAPESDL